MNVTINGVPVDLNGSAAGVSTNCPGFAANHAILTASRYAPEFVAAAYFSNFAVRDLAAAARPSLQISLTPTNTVAIRWPSTATGFGLEKNDDLGTPNWVSVPATPVDDGTTKTVVIDPPTGTWFFRLKQ